MGLSEAQINGRFQYLERPAAAPGKCAVCGAVDRPVIDMGFDLDFYGVVYLCVFCVREANTIVDAHSAGTESQAVPLSQQIDMEAVNEYLRSINNSLDRINLVIPDHFIDLLANEAIEEDAGGTDSGDAEPVSDAHADNGSEFESSSGERSYDVPSPVGSFSL